MIAWLCGSEGSPGPGTVWTWLSGQWGASRVRWVLEEKGGWIMVTCAGPADTYSRAQQLIATRRWGTWSGMTW